MDNVANMTPSAVATPAPSVSAPAPAPAPAVAQPMVANPPVMEDGGATQQSSGGIKGFFSSLNWVEVGVSILGVAALTYIIYYHRFKLKQDKMINNELQRQIDELKMNMQSAMKGRYKTL